MKRISLFFKALAILLTPQKKKIKYLLSEAKKYFNRTAEYRFINCEQRELWASLKAESFVNSCLKAGNLNYCYARVLETIKG